MKELWFLLDEKARIESRELKTTYRELSISQKNNDYRHGDVVKIRLHSNGHFDDSEYMARILDVSEQPIRLLKPGDFIGADAYSPQHLKEMLQKHYKKEFTENSVVRKISFEYA